MQIEGKRIGEGAVFIIAEAGVNHNGELGNALRMVDVAAEAGADAIKFQTFKAEYLAAEDAPKARYQIAATGDGERQFEMLKRLELGPDAHQALQKRCSERNIIFLSSPFDECSVDFLATLPVPAFKLGSGEVTNIPLLKHVGSKGRPVLLSTGMSNLEEVDQAIQTLRRSGCDEIALLHCVSNYPAAPSDANLRAIPTMKQAFGLPVGFSDHTPGITVAIGAVGVGASIIEKHFTLDKNMPGPDHKASLDPDELKSMIAGIRMLEVALGTGVKAPAASELENRAIVRRSLAAAVDIEAGTRIEPHMLRALRPGTGIPPTSLGEVVKRTAKRSVKAGELIDWTDLA
ncbi:MAG TPA: N-acetylneuraminate synthase [Terriglobia bacterium]|nr:N-acetylneuraminate synthase [Terriglobia bacterium]